MPPISGASGSGSGSGAGGAGGMYARFSNAVGGLVSGKRRSSVRGEYNSLSNGENGEGGEQ